MNLKLPFEKPIAFHPILAKIFGDVEKALYIQQLIYWSDKGKREDGYFYKTKAEIQDETSLSRRQQDRCRKYFQSIGILETKIIKADGIPTLHYHILMDRFQEIIEERLAARNETSDDPDSTNRTIQMVQTERSPGMVQTVRSESYKPDDSYKQRIHTENTENTNNIYNSPESQNAKSNIPYGQILDYLNNAIEHQFGHKGKYKLTSKFRALVKARWNEGYTYNDFTTVIDKMFLLWGNVPKMSVYLRPQTLFSTKFDAYLNTPVGKASTGDISDLTERNIKIAQEWLKEEK